MDEDDDFYPKCDIGLLKYQLMGWPTAASVIIATEKDHWLLEKAMPLMPPPMKKWRMISLSFWKNVRL